MKLVAALLALIAVAFGGFGAGRIHDRHPRPTAMAVYAACSRGNLEVFYTVPKSPAPLQVATSVAGVPLASWTETVDQSRAPIVVGLPVDEGGLRFTAKAGTTSASVVLPNC